MEDVVKKRKRKYKRRVSEELLRTLPYVDSDDITDIEQELLDDG